MTEDDWISTEIDCYWLKWLEVTGVTEFDWNDWKLTEATESWLKRLQVDWKLTEATESWLKWLKNDWNVTGMTEIWLECLKCGWKNKTAMTRERLICVCYLFR